LDAAHYEGGPIGDAPVSAHPFELPDGESGDDGTRSVPAEGLKARMAQNAGTPPGLAPISPKDAHTQPVDPRDAGRQMVPRKILDALIARSEGQVPDDTHTRNSWSVLQTMTAPGENPQAVGQIRSVVADRPLQMNANDIQTRTGQGEDNQVKENELPKDRSPDSMRSSGPESTKLHPSFPDTATAIAAEPSTTVPDKPTAVQAAAFTRTEASAAKTFQTTLMDQIVDKAAIRSLHGRSEIHIRLKPESLGKVQMNVATVKGKVVVRILTDLPVVKDAIEIHLHQLKVELGNHGLTIDKFDVVVNSDTDQSHSREQFSQMFKNNSSRNGRRQDHEENPEKGNRDRGKEADDDQPNRDGVNYFA